MTAQPATIKVKPLVSAAEILAEVSLIYIFLGMSIFAIVSLVTWTVVTEGFVPLFAVPSFGLLLAATLGVASVIIDKVRTK